MPRRPAASRAPRDRPSAETVIRSPAGTLVVGRRAGVLVADWRVDERCVDPAEATDAEAVALARALRRALAGDERSLHAFAEGPGTPFQRRVWRACRAIPRGQTQTYGELARTLGLPAGGARAVGQALRRNPLPVLVPCHRVVSAQGMGGYAGTTTGALAEVKRTLLRQEREVARELARDT